MQAKLALIRQSIISAQKQVADFRAACPPDILGFPEIDELDMGLEWSSRRVDLIRIRLDTAQGNPPG